MSSQYFNKNLALELTAEAVATFVLVSVVLYVGEPIAVAIALAAAIYLCSRLSKGSVNPAVSLGLFFRGDLSGPYLIMYVLAEIIGACLAVLWYKSAGYRRSTGTLG
jgi:aquaporin Z